MEQCLSHHGILGQKWGVRRFQNEDGTLTNAGKKRYSKEVKSLMEKSNNKLNNNYTKLYVKGFNKAADRLNNEFIEKYNKTHSVDDIDYFDAYEEMSGELINHYFLGEMLSSVKNDDYYKKAVSIVDKYSELQSDELIKEGLNTVKESENTYNKWDENDWKKRYKLN